MESLKISLIIVGPLLGLITFLLLRHYNSGLGGSLYSKRWYLRISIVTFLLSITFISLHFILPNKQNQLLDSQLTIRYNEFEKSIKEINQYLETQKKELKETNQQLNELKIEHEKLEPIVKSERKTIESLFEISDKRQTEQRLIDYMISFILGIFSTWFYNQMVKVIEKRKNNDQYKKHSR